MIYGCQSQTSTVVVSGKTFFAFNMHKESTMHLIVIRKQRDNDTPQVSELVRNAYASNISNMFLGYVFNEVTFQITMIFIALEFIFFQIRLFVCFLTVPLILLLIYVCIYGAVTMKSAQVMYEKKPIISWVAEVYEPFFQATDQKSRYKIIDDQQLEDMKEKPQGRKQIIGTVAVMRHFQNPDWAWLFRVVTDERYRRKGVAFNLINTARDWCRNHQINRLELAMSEYNQGARQLFDRAGFQVQQLYHKELLTKAYMLQMYHLSAEVRPTFS
ncbi:hypothetical protein D910_05578 [Dendroctonus ponderosae]